MNWRRNYGWIGIDFGTRVAKLAQLRREGDRLRWRRALIERSESALSLTCSGDELRQALESDGGFHGRWVACSLPMTATELRTFAVPPGTVPERRAMIAQELEAALGSQDEPREFDFWQPGTSAAGGGEQDGVQVLSAPRSTVAELTESLATAGLQCAVLDGLPCALSRAVGMAAVLPGDGPVAAIDWGYTQATVSIVEQGRAQFTRTLRDCGAGSLFREVSQALSLDDAAAVELLTRFGLPGADEFDAEGNEIREVVLDIVANHLQRMLDELTRTIAFLRLQRSALVPQRAYLFGSGARIKNAASLLASKLQLNCDVWRLAAEDEPQWQPAGAELFGPAAALSALAWKS